MRHYYYNRFSNLNYYYNEPYTPALELYNLLSFDLNSPFCSSRQFSTKRIPYLISSDHQILVHVFSHPDLDIQEQSAIREEIFFCGQWHRELDYSHFAEIIIRFFELNKNPILWISPQLGNDPRRTKSNSAFYFSIRTDTLHPENILSLNKRIQFNHANGNEKLIQVNYYNQPTLFDRDETRLPRSTLTLENPKTLHNSFSTYRDLQDLVRVQQRAPQEKFGIFSSPKKPASKLGPRPVDADLFVVHK